MVFNMMDGKTVLRLAIPSDGALHEPTQTFLRACGLGVARTNLRRYTASIPSLPGVTAVLQRASDIPLKVEEGSADMGLVGMDRFLESRREGGNCNIVMENLGFGHCELVLGVPDSWVDVASLADLADLSMEFRQEGRDLRVATKYPRLVERFLLGSGVNYFSLVQSSGTLEVAPAMGYADIIADISETGTTMRENRLKTIHGGSILTSEACLISNKVMLANDERKLALAKSLVELIEAHLESREYYSVTANMKGETPDDIARYVLRHTEIAGLRGPTIAKVYTRNGDGWYAVTVIVEKNRLLKAVERLREIGGSSVTVSQPNYVFLSECKAHARLT
jgi:ATP phosphoribosyltransferase